MLLFSDYLDLMRCVSGNYLADVESCDSFHTEAQQKKLDFVHVSVEAAV